MPERKRSSYCTCSGWKEWNLFFLGVGGMHLLEKHDGVSVHTEEHSWEANDCCLQCPGQNHSFQEEVTLIYQQPDFRPVWSTVCRASGVAVNTLKAFAHTGCWSPAPVPLLPSSLSVFACYLLAASKTINYSLFRRSHLQKAALHKPALLKFI